MKRIFLLLVSVAVLFVACSKNEETKTETPQAGEQTTETAAPQATADANAVQITLNAGDDMRYDQLELKVKEGSTVKLTLNHTGKAPKLAMGHNFVLLNTGVDVNKFDQDAVGAKDTDYIPASHASDIIAHTKLIGGGETTDVTFKAPAKGTYDYICSFPGHAATMHGKFIVE